MAVAVRLAWPLSRRRHPLSDQRGSSRDDEQKARFKRACGAPVILEPLALLHIDLCPQRQVLQLVDGALGLGIDAEEAVREGDVDLLGVQALEGHKDLLAALRPDQTRNLSRHVRCLY